MSETQTQTNANLRPYNAHMESIRVMVRSIYAQQKLRIQIGNRITKSFKAKLGIADSATPESEADPIVVKILDDLRRDHARITDGVVATSNELSSKLPTERKFRAEGLITDYSELIMVDGYIQQLRAEQKQFRDLEKVLKNIPIYTEWLANIAGVGPAMAAVLISEIDIHRANYPSSIVKYAGLDVVQVSFYDDEDGKRVALKPADLTGPNVTGPNEDGTMFYKGRPIYQAGMGRNKSEVCRENREYLSREGKVEIRSSITFSPFLRTKLIAILGPAFLKASSMLVDGKRMGNAKRLELAIDNGYEPQKNNPNEKDEIIEFLKRKDYQVVPNESPYARTYYDYKARLTNHPKHKNKTPKHIHNMAVRYCVKFFLYDLYREWRTLEGLPVAAPYHEDKLSMVHGEVKPESVGSDE